MPFRYGAPDRSHRPPLPGVELLTDGDIEHMIVCLDRMAASLRGDHDKPCRRQAGTGFLVTIAAALTEEQITRQEARLTYPG